MTMSAYTFFLITVCLASFVGASGGVLFIRLVLHEKRTVQGAMQEYFDRKEQELNQMISRTNIPKAAPLPPRKRKAFWR